MRNYLICKIPSFFLGVVLTLSALQPLSSSAQDNVTLAIFQFRPESIEAMGYESDVMLAVRNEIGNRDALRLIPKRDMEDVLSRKDIDQSYSVANAIQAGQMLSVRFVLIGTVRKEGAQIEAEMKLVDVNTEMEVGVWQTSYRSRNEIDKAAARLVEEIVVVATQPMEETAAGVTEEIAAPYVPAPQQISVEPLSTVVAEARGDRIELRWNPLAGRESLGYNVYRAETRQGPYEFLDTAEGTSYTDAAAQPNTAYFYRIGEVDMDGMEHRSDMIARGMIIAAMTQPSVAPISNVPNTVESGYESSIAGPAQTANRNESGVDRDTPDYQLEPIMDEGPLVAATAKAEAETNSALSVLDQLPAALDITDSGDRNDSGSASIVAAEEPSSGLPMTVSQTARNNDGESAVLDVNTGPPLPAELIAADQGLLRQAKLIWGPATRGSGYRIYRRGPGLGWMRIADINGLANTIYTDAQGLRDDSVYAYSYTIVDGDIESPRSEPVDIRTKAPLPAPGGLQAESGLVGQVRLQWEPVMDPDVKGYAVYRGGCSEELNFDVVQVGETEGPGETYWVDLGVPPNTIEAGSCYRYAVETLFAPGGVGPLTPAVRAETRAP